MKTIKDLMDQVGFTATLSQRFFSAGLIMANFYDEENERYPESDFKFNKPLFADNPESFERFFDFISELDANPDYSSIDIQITPDYVIVFYKTPKAKIFRRTPRPIDPLNYVD